MSLVGNLADLGLGEILQIVSLSRKSGVLTLHSKGRQGVVVFRFGQVVRATSSTIRYFLGEELLQRKIVDEECLNRALQQQQAGAYKERLGPILINRFDIPVEKIESVVREQIENVVYSFFSWDEGSFEFELQDDIETIDDSKIDPLQFMLQQGLNPQFLAMEGSRIIDEKRHRGDHVDDQPIPEPEVAVPVEPAVAPIVARPFSPGEIIVVEDDQGMREFLSELTSVGGGTVLNFAGSEEALITIDTMFREGARPMVLIDLIMPRMDGSGVLGGLELFEIVKNNYPELKVLVISDYRNIDAERKIRDAGATFLVKPRKSEFADHVCAEQFAARIRGVLEGVDAGVQPEDSDDVNLGDELRVELGDTGGDTPSTVVPSTGISQLRSILEELNDYSSGSGVMLLLLRFASDFVSRGIIFNVKNGMLAGCGQFGVYSEDQPADILVRSFSIPLDGDSIFTEALKTRLPQKIMPKRSPWNEYLYGRIGSEPAMAFIGPLLSEGRVVALLYGDNPESGAIGDTDSLEIFLSQAGIAMERALLSERLKKIDQEVS